MSSIDSVAQKYRSLVCPAIAQGLEQMLEQAEANDSLLSAFCRELD